MNQALSSLLACQLLLGASEQLEGYVGIRDTATVVPDQVCSQSGPRCRIYTQVAYQESDPWRSRQKDWDGEAAKRA
jgi:hypothetical protein